MRGLFKMSLTPALYLTPRDSAHFSAFPFNVKGVFFNTKSGRKQVAHLVVVIPLSYLNSLLQLPTWSLHD